ncbi:MAG TPA: FtsX-like permease family protein, partial [Puia sp.]|nr:FtsX-like permease family protein [Puia sp.]
TDSGFHPFTVAAVAEDMPLNTSISFDVLGNYQYLEMTDTDRVKSSANWGLTYGDETYLLLRPGSRLPQQTRSLQAFRQQHFPEEAGGFKAADLGHKEAEEVKNEAKGEQKEGEGGPKVGEGGQKAAKGGLKEGEGGQKVAEGEPKTGGGGQKVGEVEPKAGEGGQNLAKGEQKEGKGDQKATKGEQKAAESRPRPAKVQARYVLQPLLSIHTDTSVQGASPTIDAKNIWILIGIAAGIVLIASINFTTLAIARSAGRAREVGVRKVVGGLRRQLIGQFLTESVLLSILSAVIGYILALALLPWFNQLAGKHLAFSFRIFPQLSWMLVGLTLLVGLLAGFYPALVLSGFNTIEVMKAKIKLGGSNLFTRSLVTFQFVLSIGLIIATVVMVRQVNFMRSKDLGLVKENTVLIHAGNIDAATAYPLFRQELAGNPSVRGVAASGIGLGEGEGYYGGGYDFNGKRTGVIEYPVDENFIPVMGVRLVAGRNFDRGITSDTAGNIIVNETLVHDDLGITPRQAIGQQIKTASRPRSNPRPEVKTIIGVVRDFNFERLNKKVRPQLFSMPANFTPSVFFIHLGAGDPTQALDQMAAVWRRLSPDIPFSYSFLDENLDRFYKSEARWGNIIACAGGISIFLACLGLFGLAALSAANRVKEIGIRRILGASTAAIVGLLTGGFLRLVVIAAVIASPIAWVIMNRWLRDFAYRIDVGWWVFAVTALAAMGIAFLTIGLQAFRAARINPVENLRVE